MRTSKYVGFLFIGLGALLVVGAAVLPVSPATQRYGLFRIDIGDNCGPAGIVAVHDVNAECVSAARHRLLATSAIGLLAVAFGMALFAGSDGEHSQLAVSSRRVKRRRLQRSPGSRRYTPG